MLIRATIQHAEKRGPVNGLENSWGYCCNCGEEIPLNSRYVEEEMIRIGPNVLVFEIGKCPRPSCEALTERYVGSISLN